ncbi:MAG: TIM barrel protein [Phycisphaerae bacterium]|nr:TIM barrel protein [Phycisphaerae bacterium]
MTTRRTFLKQSLKIGAAASASGIVLDSLSSTARAADVTQPDVAAWMAKAGGPRGWRIGSGLNGYMSSASTHKKNYPIWEVLDFCQKEGFDGIELVVGWPMGGYPGAEEKKRIDALKGLYDKYGLKVYTIQPDSPGRPFAESAEERKRWVDAFTGQIRLCKALGCDFVGHWPGGPLGSQTIDQAIGHCVESYREAAKRCADAGIWMSFEIEPPFIFHTLDHLKRILEGVGHPACRTNYDPSHFDVMSGSKGKPEVMLKELGVKHIGHVHLTDTDGTMFGGTSKHLACGEGHCDIPASLMTLWEGGYRGWIMIDAWMIDDAYNANRKGKQAIDRALTAVGRPPKRQ